LEHGMGHRLAVAVPVRQPGIVDVALVHEAPALAPPDGRDEVVEHDVGTVQETAREVDPRRLVELDALEGHARVERRLARREQRTLVDRHAVHSNERLFVLSSGFGGPWFTRAPTGARPRAPATAAMPGRARPARPPRRRTRCGA